MKRVLWMILVLGAIAPSALSAEEAPKITGSYAVEHGVRVLRLWGTPEERGFAQGYLLAEEIVAGMNAALTQVLALKPGLYETYLVPLVPAGFAFSKAEEDELAGLLEGMKARIPDAAKRKIEILGREPNLVDMKIMNTFGDWYALGCSSAAMWGERTADKKPVVVRNFDFPTMDLLVGSQHVRVVVPGPESRGEHGWVGICHPGGIGTMTAMSEGGVFIAIHDVPVQPTQADYMQKNVPRLVAVKRIAAEVPAAGAVEKALALCRSWNTLFGNNFIVATPEADGGLPAGVIEYDTREDQDGGATLRAPENLEEVPLPYVVCSNHHRRRKTGECGRYRALMEGCATAGAEPLTVADLFAIAELTAVPNKDRTVADGRFGTLHEVVAITGTKRLWVRFVKPDGNIRGAEPVEIDVVKILAGTVERAGKR